MLSEIFSNLGKFCGLNVPAEIGHSTKKEVDKYIEHSTKGAVPLANYLSYRYFDDESKLFYNEGNILGFMMEIAPIVGSSPDIEKNLNLFFNNELPQGAYIQFLLVASHNIENKLNLWKRERFTIDNKLLHNLTQYREAYLRERARDFSSIDGRMGRDFRVYVSYSGMNGNKDSKVKEVNNFRRKLFQKFSGLKLHPRMCNAEDLITIAADITQMQLANRKRQKYDYFNPIADQMFKPLTQTIIEDEAIIHEKEGLVTKCLYPFSLPTDYSLLEMIDLLGSEQAGQSIPARFVISYTLATDIDKSASLKILARGKRAIDASRQSYSKDDTNLREEVAEWHEVIHRSKEGERFLTESMQIMITSTKSEIGIAEESIKNLYNCKDWQLEISKNFQLPALLSILPMQQAKYLRMLKNIKLARLVQSKEVVAKLPIHGEWKGAPKSGVMLLGRRGEMFNWNPFYRVGGAGNFNVCVMAPAGSGKSVLLQELATTALSQGVSVFILDIGASYQNICELVGGENVRFNSASDLSLNPFAGLAGNGLQYIKASELLKRGETIERICAVTGLSEVQLNAYLEGLNSKQKTTNEADDVIEILQIGKHFVTKDSIIYAKTIIAAMCGIKGDAHLEGILNLAINKGIEEFGNELDITKLATILNQLEGVEAGKMLAETLYPFTDKGMHGRYFKAGKTASFKEMMTVFEFEEIKNDTVLLGVVLQVILMQITMQFLCGDRSRQFLLIVDEAWMILDFCAPFLEAFARTVRKYGGSLVTCVQDLASFHKGTSQKAILENSSWKAVLKQTRMEAFHNDDELKKFVPLIESVTKEASGKYSEVLLQSSGITIVGRLVLDPYSLALYSTEREDFNFLKICKDKGMSKDAAVKELSKKYGALPDISKLDIATHNRIVA